jgi:hypothetical protein
MIVLPGRRRKGAPRGYQFLALSTSLGSFSEPARAQIKTVDFSAFRAMLLTPRERTTIRASAALHKRTTM